MIRTLREEFDRAVRDYRIWLALFLGLAFLSYGVFNACGNQWIPKGFSFADLWYFTYVGSYFAYLLPLAAALPFADSLAVDRGEGFMRYLVMRSKYRPYILAKFIANAVVGGLVVLIPLLALYGVTNLIAPRGVFLPNTWQPNVSGRPYGVLQPLFITHPDGFILLVSLLAAGMGALYGSLGLAVSLVIPNRYLALGFPFALYLLSDFVARRTHLFGPDWSPLAAVAGSVFTMEETVRSFFLNPLAALGLTLALALFFGRRRRILQ